MDISSSEKQSSMVQHDLPTIKRDVDDSHKFIKLGSGIMDSKMIMSISSDNKGYNQTYNRLRNANNIPKLLLPKFSRPAMYSLNGFIPRPNIRRYTTTSSTTSTSIADDDIMTSSAVLSVKKGRKSNLNRESKSSYYIKYGPKVIN